MKNILQFIDIRDANSIEVEIREGNVWITVDGACRFRAQKTKNIFIQGDVTMARFNAGNNMTNKQ